MVEDDIGVVDGVDVTGDEVEDKGEEEEEEEAEEEEEVEVLKAGDVVPGDVPWSRGEGEEVLGLGLGAELVVAVAPETSLVVCGGDVEPAPAVEVTAAASEVVFDPGPPVALEGKTGVSAGVVLELLLGVEKLGIGLVDVTDS